jgi:hypothetical protein
MRYHTSIERAPTSRSAPIAMPAIPPEERVEVPLEGGSEVVFEREVGDVVVVANEVEDMVDDAADVERDDVADGVGDGTVCRVSVFLILNNS